MLTTSNEQQASSRLNMCCAYTVAVQDNPIFKGKRLRCDTCGREVVYPDNGTGWKYVEYETDEQRAKEARS